MTDEADPPANGSPTNQSNSPPVDALTVLQDGQVLDCKPIPWGSNYTFALALALDPEPPALAIYKPRRGEAPLWDFPDGTLYRREYAAYLVSQALGWDFIPPTVIRDGPHGVGSVQLYVAPDPQAHFYQFRSQHQADLQRIAAFDLIANNADRKAAHCLRDEAGRIWAIDHGLTFHADPKLRTVIWDFCGQPIPGPLVADLEALRRDSTPAALDHKLRKLLATDELKAFWDRLYRLLRHPVYPDLDPRRNRPYEFW